LLVVSYLHITVNNILEKIKACNQTLLVVLTV